MESVWRRTAAWQYRKPEANEPSDAAYTMHRVLSFVGLIVVVVLAVIILSASNRLESQQEQRGNDDGSIISAEEWRDGLRPSPILVG